MGYGYGYIEEVVVMRPEDYYLWSLSDTNIYVTDNAREDMLVNYGMKPHELYSLYEMTKVLTRDRNFAELRGIDMDSKESIIRGLSRIGFLSIDGIDSRGLGFNVDRSVTPSGSPVMVLSLYEMD